MAPWRWENTTPASASSCICSNQTVIIWLDIFFAILSSEHSAAAGERVGCRLLLFFLLRLAHGLFPELDP